MRFHKGRDVFGCVSRVARRAVLTFGNWRSATDARRATLHSSPSTFHSSGFTLIELLIVTVVIVTLMGIVFRLAGAGGDSRAKSMTIARMQRLENAISGYYAAFGSYPPVPLQGRSRGIDVKVNRTTGVQGGASDTGSCNLANPDDETKRQVEAACRAQPVAVLFPFFMNGSANADRKTDAEKLVTALRTERKASFSPLTSPGGLHPDKSDWSDVNLFQFGLLSFLLPRYLFMLQGDPSFYEGRNGAPLRRGQWWVNNQRPCRIDTGRPYDSWEEMQKWYYKGNPSVNDAQEISLIENLPSQAVCARWMPNLEGIVAGGLDFYGVNTSDTYWSYFDANMYDGLPGYRKWLHQASPNGYKGESSLYLLNGMTVSDGWGNEFYYHSDVPYQSYRLWSAGPNRYTFPPWLDLDKFNQKEQETIANWTKDDVSHLAN